VAVPTRPSACSVPLVRKPSLLLSCLFSNLVFGSLAGSFSAQGSKTCTPCPTGFFSASAGAQSCVPSEPGNITVPSTQKWAPDCHPTNNACIADSPWNITLGSTGQSLCEAGTYSLGSTGVCIKCSVGYYSVQVGATSALTCQKCAPGSYADQPGSTVCTGCGPGEFFFWGVDVTCALGLTLFSQATTGACRARPTSLVAACRVPRAPSHRWKLQTRACLVELAGEFFV
jgi:hypothetical protein